MRSFGCLLLVLAALPAVCQPPATARLDVLVKDEGARPLSGARVEIAPAEPIDGARGITTGETNELGHLLFANLRPGRYSRSRSSRPGSKRS